MLALLVAGFVAAAGYIHACVSLTHPDISADREP